MTTSLDTTTAVPTPRIALAWGLAALWALLVWGLGGEDLSLDSTSRILGPLFRFLFPGISEATNEQLQWAVRKTAHLMEYGLLAVLVLRALWLGGRPGPTAAAWCAVAIAAAFAAADETRQSWSAARLGSAWDVLLDTAGAALAVAAVAFARERWPRMSGRLGIPAPLDRTAANDATGDPE